MLERTGRVVAIGAVMVLGSASCVGMSPLNCTTLDENCAALWGSDGGVDGSSDATVSDATSDGGGDGSLGDATTDGGASDAAADAGDASPHCDAGLSYCPGAGCIPLDTVAHCGSCTTACTAAPDGGSPACTIGGGEDASYSCGFSCNQGEHPCGAACYPNGDAPTSTGDTCIVSDSFAVFVSAGGSSSNPGTMEQPLSSISAGIAAAAKSGGLGRVYVCGSFAEDVTVGALAVDVAVFGGFSCSGSPWTYSSATQAQVAPASGIPLSIVSPGHAVSFQDVAFKAPNGADGTGASSIGAFVNAGSAQVAFTHVSITAGTGGSGVNGTIPNVNYDGGTAPTGNAANGPYGALSLTCECLDPTLLPDAGTGGLQTSVGGSGGSGAQSPATPSSGGNGFPVAASGSAGDGGVYTGSACQNGNTGAVGTDGSGGKSSVLTVGLSASGWAQSGGQGGAGTAGAVGQGGGGGSGGNNAGHLDAGGGGGGGCGGCGGEFGAGGGPGGSSIGLAIYETPNVQLTNVVVVSGNAGQGGTGATGQAGQNGGLSGNPSTPGCLGGSGGNGGNGGGGAGGSGGNSYAIALVRAGDGGGPIYGGTNTTTAGAAGAAGPAGAGGTPSAQDGWVGAAADLAELNGM